MYIFLTSVFILCPDLMSQLDEERKEVSRLEQEKKAWLSRGVHAEFEKKDKVCLLFTVYSGAFFIFD